MEIILSIISIIISIIGIIISLFCWKYTYNQINFKNKINKINISDENSFLQITNLTKEFIDQNGNVKNNLSKNKLKQILQIIALNIYKKDSH